MWVCAVEHYWKVQEPTVFTSIFLKQHHGFALVDPMALLYRCHAVGRLWAQAAS
jgi:hypothetical protein